MSWEVEACCDVSDFAFFRTPKIATAAKRGNLRIGDHWNAITIIALSQSNPLKAVAELVENSIDARAKTIVITRGKERDSIICA